MMPGGHLATSVVLAAGAYVTTGSFELAAGCVAGGFFIDTDHYLDYIVFERQWRRPGPASFLRYYFTNKPVRIVLPLHSYELMTLLAIIAVRSPMPLLVGYLIGAAMHLAFDIAINGDHALRHRFLFYCFAYRAHLNFRAADLLDVGDAPPETGSHPFLEALTWRPPNPRKVSRGLRGLHADLIRVIRVIRG
jgi:hypothetical protein